MDKIKEAFHQSDLFKLTANFPEAVAKDLITKLGNLSEEEQQLVTDAFMEVGFHLTAAASASYRLTHAVDMMRNQGNMGPDIRYLIMESSSELTNAVLLVEPIMKVNDVLVKFGEGMDQWTSDVPDIIPDDGIDIMYLRNYADIVKGKLIYFRYKDIENQSVITDIPCIYDEALHSYMPLTNNPAWKYIDGTTDSQESITDAGPTTDPIAQESTGSENN